MFKCVEVNSLVLIHSVSDSMVQPVAAETHSRRPAGRARGRPGGAAGWASWPQPPRRCRTGASRQNSPPPDGSHPRRSRVCAGPCCTAWSPVPPGLRTGGFQNKGGRAEEREGLLCSFVKTKSGVWSRSHGAPPAARF